MIGSAKILDLIKGYTDMERLDFTNNLLTFANKRDKRQIDILLPALKVLVSTLFNVYKDTICFIVRAFSLILHFIS